MSAAQGEDFVLPARLFGRLLLRELDADLLAELSQPDIASALTELGIELPGADQLQQLAAEFFAEILQPASRPPLVQSLWTEARFDGNAAVAVRKIADGLGLELGKVARSAPADHLGCLLALWAELRESHPEHAAAFATHHLAWVAGSSAPKAAGSSFYASVLRATANLVADICASPSASDASAEA